MKVKKKVVMKIFSESLQLERIEIRKKTKKKYVEMNEQNKTGGSATGVRIEAASL